MLLTLPSPVRAQIRDFAPPAALAAVGALAVVLAVRMNRPRGPPARRRPAPDVRRGPRGPRGPGTAGRVSRCPPRSCWPGTWPCSSSRPGSPARPPPVAVLLPLAVLALLAVGLPLNIGWLRPPWRASPPGRSARRGSARTPESRSPWSTAC
ncbi:hypothetical protein LT493_22180 [Streptomyces tricolor]|nr:hypothetical protein [Streptomyces tricolor]